MCLDVLRAMKREPDAIPAQNLSWQKAQTVYSTARLIIFNTNLITEKTLNSMPED